MGLDMYLRHREYVSGYEFQEQAEKDRFAEVVKVLTIPPVADTPSVHLDATVGYWRKANHIHQWFVTNVQGGVDECQEAEVSTEQLRELLTLCEEVAAHHEKAEDLLPTTSGFFFGGTEYDTWYFSDIEDTIKILKPLVSNPAARYFVYQSSW